LALRAKRIAAFFVLSFVIFVSWWLKNGFSRTRRGGW